jgi:hypothetical protein
MKPIVFAVAFAALVSIEPYAIAQGQDRAFQFALIGDMPYSKLEEQQFANLIAVINSKELAFVVHVGDMQLDSRNYNANASRVSIPCNDEYDAWFLGMLQRIRHPVIVTPGDNDWTDCHFLTVRKADPLDRLARVRKTFFPEGRSLGQRTIAVESQAKDAEYSKFRENLHWSMGGVTFATVHIVGSNDNFGRTPEMDVEHRERKAANIAWMKHAFALAKTAGSRGLCLMVQANPEFENQWPAGQRATYSRMIVGTKPPEPAQPSVFQDYLTVLADEIESYDKPVAFLHGDTHRFRIDHSLFSIKTNRRFENFIRVETYGSPDIHWVKVTVDPAEVQVFRFDPQIVPENVVNRRVK